MGVTFEDMVIKSMRLYWKKTDDYDSLSSAKATKYNKKYFDGVESEMVPQGEKLSKPEVIKKTPGMSANFDKPPNGPIPGENYTSDTKNYPWHRPPEITNLDQGIEASAKQLMSEEASSGLVTMLQAGLPISSLTDMFVTSGIGAGKWTPDFAILLAGPVSHIMQLMAKGYGIDADLGIDLPKNKHTISYLKNIQSDQQKIDDVYQALNDPAVVSQIDEQVKGIMGMAQQQQAAQQPQQVQPDAMPEGDLQ